MEKIQPGTDVPSTMGPWIQAIVRALDDQGVNGTELALRAGIHPRVLHNAEERAPQPAVTRLWAMAVEATGNPCFGLLVPRFVSPVTFHALGYAILASPTFKAVFQRLIRFQRLISDATEQRLELDGDRYRIVIERLSPLGPPHEGIDAFMATGIRTLRGLSGSRRVNPLALYLQRPEPQPSELFHRLFRCPIHFNAARDAAEYSRKDVEAPLPHANADLAKHSDTIVAEYLARSGRSGTLSDRVHALLVEHLPDGGPSEATIAQHLSMGPRNLQLQLAQEGTSYKDLLNRARQNLARSYLQQGKYSIKEVAFLLGFADAATFTRAFHRWTGESPGRFAARSAEKPAP
jgi:AraC-like DNA-binding protein